MDRRGAYGPAKPTLSRPTVRPLSSLRLMAALVGSLALAAPAGAQFDPFHRAPPADIPGDPNEAAGLVLRINRLEEELRQANGRIEQLENAERRLEDQLQKFRQDVEFRFGERSDAGPLEPDAAEPPATVSEAPAPPRPKKSDAFDPEANPNAPGAPQALGTTAPSAPLVHDQPLPNGPLVRDQPPAGPPLNLGNGPPAPPPAAGPT